MIVKDEGHLIRETLKHLLTYIRFDSWCICDTGSTDNTISEIESFFATEGIPGSIHRHEWKDFAHNRTLAFQMAYNTSDYSFVWDADDEIVGDFKLPKLLNRDWYRFTFGARGCTQYRRCQLFNNRKKWKYVGVLHECPSCCEACESPEDIHGEYHFVSGRRGARNKDPLKYAKDAAILDKAFHETFQAKDDLYKRYAFYCAQSYLCAGEREKAAEFYKKVLTFDTWSQEQYISCLEIYDSYEHMGKSQEGLYYLVESFRYDAHRAECVVRLIKYYLNAGLPHVALMYYRGIQEYYENHYEKDAIQEKLFVRRCDPDFYLPYYMIIVAERTKQLDICAKMFTSILTYKFMGVTPWWIQNAFHNLQFFVDYIPKTIEYVQKIMGYLDLAASTGKHLQEAQNSILYKYLRSCDAALTAPAPLVPIKQCSRVRVMLTITTCKRLDLFQKTVRSMLNMWTDLGDVDFFFCVDDASSEEDRKAMVTEFPFFSYYMKTDEERGHRESMNIIWTKLNEVKPEYWIHLEDDWLYFRKKGYVKEAIQLLEKYESQDIHQVVFNRNYGVIYEDIDRVGGIDLGDALLHEKRDGLVGKNCGYWPHYSLQPSMIRARVVLALGDYSSPNVFFERDYANKYFAAGYKTIFFPSIYSNHIGKQHWEKEGKNAYALNTVKQFAVAAAVPTTPVVPAASLVPLSHQGSMGEHLQMILKKITAGTPFGLIRPSDGERTVLLNKTLTNCDHWTFTEGGRLQKDLLEAIQTVDPNLYIGIPCDTCNLPWNCTKEIYSDFIDRFKVPLAQRTYANIFGNSNWKTFAEFIKGYSRGFYCITSGTKISEVSVKGVFPIDDKLVNRWDEEADTITEKLMAFIQGKKGELFLFSAGPLSKVWIPKCMKENPENMYVDVGGALDIFTKGASNRFYTNDGHEFARQWCMFSS
jgi:glycosyltransferase involved in cell wall biosynthesis